MKPYKKMAPEAAATAPRAGYVACGKPTRPDTSASGQGQSPNLRPIQIAATDNTGGKQAAEPERRAA